MVVLQKIEKSYPMGKDTIQALKQIDLSVPQGGFLSIQGASGSGKSTLMNILGCLDTPDAGRYLLQGEDVVSLSKRERARLRRRSIGFIFQSFYLIPQLTALEQVELPLTYAGVPLSERRERAAAALDAVGLASRRNHLPSELSGGQQQRVAIARALVPGAPLLLADEPTGNLDPRTGRAILELLEREWRHGRTLILITHDPKIAARAPLRITLKNGLIDEPT